MGISGVSYSERLYQYYSQMQAGGKSRDRALGRDMVDYYEGQVSSAADPKAQVWADYQAWKAQQPPRYLPRSVGATEENIRYLREHFSGKLDLFQRIDSADTMVDMGILTREQMLNWLGLGESTIGVLTAEHFKVRTMPVGASPELTSWLDFFGQKSCLGVCDTLDKLLEVLDVRLRVPKDGDESVADQIRAVLTQITQVRPA